MKMTTSRLAVIALAVLPFAVCCGGKREAPVPAASAPAANAPAAPGAAPAAAASQVAAPDYAALLSTPDRPAADAVRDVSRKPAQVLAFAKIVPGESVFEEEAGGGYYTELLSRAVGRKGHIVMQAPQEFAGYYKKETDPRLTNNRLANVKVSASHFDKLDAADNSIDVVTWFLGPHELWFRPSDAPNGYGDPAKSFAEAYRIVKPGGYFVVMDHVAAAGAAPEKSGNDLHRIDPAVIKKLAEGAGFRLDEASNLLTVPSDDHTKSVFDASVKGNTDQVLLRYRKPS